MAQQLRCPIDDRYAEEEDDQVFVHADDGSPLCTSLPDIIES